MYSSQYDNFYAREGINLSGKGFIKEDYLDELIRKQASLTQKKIIKKEDQSQKKSIID